MQNWTLDWKIGLTKLMIVKNCSRNWELKHHLRFSCFRRGVLMNWLFDRWEIQKATDSKVYACLDADLSEVLFHSVVFCDKENRDLSSKIYRVSFGGISEDLLDRYTYLSPPKCLLMKKIYKTKFEIEEENTKLQIARSCFCNSYCKKIWEISPKQNEENQRQNQIIAGERLPTWSLSLITKIILIIYTTANSSSNTSHVAFWWLLVTLKSECVNIF